MKNSLRLLADLIELFPEDQAPETTKDYGAYYHPMFAKGTIDELILEAIDSKQKLSDRIIDWATGVK